MLLACASSVQMRQWGLSPEEICGHSDEMYQVLVNCVFCIGRSAFPFCHLCDVLQWKMGSRNLRTNQEFGPGGCLDGRRIAEDLLVLLVELSCQLWMTRGRTEISTGNEYLLSAEHLEAV